MIRHAFVVAAAFLLPLVVAGCPDNDGGGGEGEGEGEGDGAGEGEGAAEGEGEGEGDDFGFDVRTPTTVNLPCEQGAFGCGADSTTDVLQIDTLCEFDVGRNALVYVQATPTSVSAIGFPFFDDVSGFLHDKGSGNNSQIEATYDYGGNHHNDSFDVVVDGVRYRYDHSSFGFGFRACQAPDCIQTLDDAGNIVDDGCTAERTHPIACAYVESSTLPSLEPDPFAFCAGDPNHP